jgi:hypothetical protein
VVSNGTDAPVEDLDPIPNYYASVTPQDEGRQGVLSRPAHEPHGRAEVMTLAPAYAAIQEDSRGSLKVGKLADVTVLSKDITTIPEDESSPPTSFTRSWAERFCTSEALTTTRAPTSLASARRRLLLLRHMPPELVEKAARRPVESIGQLAAGVAGHRPEPRPCRLRAAHVVGHARATLFLRPHGRRWCSRRALHAASRQALRRDGAAGHVGQEALRHARRA